MSLWPCAIACIVFFSSIFNLIVWQRVVPAFAADNPPAAVRSFNSVVLARIVVLVLGTAARAWELT